MQIIPLTKDNVLAETMKIRQTRQAQNADIAPIVTKILSQVKQHGDEALKKYTLQFDNVALDTFRVSEEEVQRALKQVDANFLSLLKQAHANISAYHALQLPKDFSCEKDGLSLSQRHSPVERVGIYIPGGKTAYASTVLMNVIPAKLAGVQMLVLVTPPRQDGTVSSDILAAAHVCGAAEHIYKAGGAQAIAALAYGTKSIPSVYKITGPGNLFVAEAKKQVYGQVDIDMIAGPSEILILADASAPVSYIAADILSQAEHDTDAVCILACTSRDIAKKVLEEIDRQLGGSANALRAQKALAQNGKIFVCDEIDTLIALTNEIAPEHVEVMTDGAEAAADKINNAGNVFIGPYSPVAAGDYFAGPNHTIPTSGKAKFFSPLSTADFMKHSNRIAYTKEGFFKDRDAIAAFAEQERFFFHAAAALRRKPND